MATLDVTTTANVPTNTSASVKIYEDTDGDGTAENTATQSIDDGTNTYSLTGFDRSSGNDYWFDFMPDNSDDVSTAHLDSLEIA